MPLDVRKLAAIDLYFLGPPVILTEFAIGVVGPLLLGALTLRMASRHGWPLGLTLFGAYLLSLGANYVPLLLHALRLVRNRNAQEVIADELLDRRASSRKYRRESLCLLVPFMVPFLAIVQYNETRRQTHR